MATVVAMAAAFSGAATATVCAAVCVAMAAAFSGAAMATVVAMAAAFSAAASATVCAAVVLVLSCAVFSFLKALAPHFQVQVVSPNPIV